MSESLYEPLPDVDAYLNRIGIERPVELTTGYLDRLVYAHQCSVPFEDLDVCDKGLEPDLGKAALFDKVVNRRRGGYCFELNGLFHALLAELGYDVRASMARVLTRPIAHPAISHRANVVTIDSVDYLVDVGFGGPMPPFALKLEEGFARTEHGQTFTSRAAGPYWWNIWYAGSSSAEKPVVRVCTVPAEEQDFVALSFYQSQNPQSVFRTVRLVNVRTEDGAHDIRGTTYTRFSHGEKTVCELADNDELDAVLERHFNIVDWR